ncbi:hypothetical protein C437_15371 [Haloarcula vallismortis ATCC 29715]|uniref:Uncharacterized protein n=1 Tax=Haloarcula vallismortis ATCC 29715 TaxID=662477 RepID=M0IY70_HALVA|nr:hypothetical protein [Haloarcula vallismortis]EMA01812.1 hypothetical protein C437_15371 [Haloarcula vallismortis ATCC 29715]
MRLVLLGGYASITAVLATADWAGLSALVMAAPIVTAALYLGGRRFVGHLTERAQQNLDERGSAHTLATDGDGRSRREQLIDGIEEHGSGAVRDEALLNELETTAGDRNTATPNQ